MYILQDSHRGKATKKVVIHKSNAMNQSQVNKPAN